MYRIFCASFSEDRNLTATVICRPFFSTEPVKCLTFLMKGKHETYLGYSGALQQDDTTELGRSLRRYVLLENELRAAGKQVKFNTVFPQYIDEAIFLNFLLRTELDATIGNRAVDQYIVRQLQKHCLVLKIDRAESHHLSDEYRDDFLLTLSAEEACRAVCWKRTLEEKPHIYDLRWKLQKEGLSLRKQIDLFKIRESIFIAEISGFVQYNQEIRDFLQQRVNKDSFEMYQTLQNLVEAFGSAKGQKNAGLAQAFWKHQSMSFSEETLKLFAFLHGGHFDRFIERQYLAKYYEKEYMWDYVDQYEYNSSDRCYIGRHVYNGICFDLHEKVSNQQKKQSYGCVIL